MSDTKRRDFGRPIATWHRWLTGRSPLDEDDSSAEKKLAGNLRALSDLRRCTDARDAMLTIGFGRLVAFVHPAAAAMGATTLHPDEISALARTALIMSRVTRCRFQAPDFGRIPQMMSAQVKNRNMPCVSTNRAAVLFSAPDANEACRNILSILPLLRDGMPELDPGHIYQAMRWWDDTRRRWAMDYHAFTSTGVVDSFGRENTAD